MSDLPRKTLTGPAHKATHPYWGDETLGQEIAPPTPTSLSMVE